jgi:hypothetical protein
VAATERKSERNNALMAAALALPGLAVTLAPPAVRAETPPDQATIAFKQLYYRDDQPGAQRMKVLSPAAYWMVPVKDVASVEGYVTQETISGASPYYYNTLSGASGQITEDRRAADIKVTRYFDRAAVGIGVAGSTEHDFRSQAVRTDARFATDDQNTTLSLGYGHTGDSISSTVDPTLHASRNTDAALLGLTQVWSPTTIAQATLSATFGHGYFSDPYKLFDQRPNERRQVALLGRVNHYLVDTGGALHYEYRYYQDDWGIRASNIEVAYYQPFADSWMVKPSLRYYTQSAARFYNTSFPPPVFGADYSADQRLAGFGAVDAGVQVVKQFKQDFVMDFSIDTYTQRTSWRAFGGGTPGLEPFHALYITLGLSKKF